jgi:uncharacterized protein
LPERREEAVAAECREATSLRRQKLRGLPGVDPCHGRSCDASVTGAVRPSYDSGLWCLVTIVELSPPEWSTLEIDGSLFSSGRWLDEMGRRIEGSSVWAIAGPAAGRVGLFGKVRTDPRASASTDPWTLLFGGSSLVRTLDGETRRQQKELTHSAPPAEEWFPALVFAYPGLECFPVGPGAGSPEAVGELVAESLAWARERALALVAFLYVPPEQELLAAVLDEAGLVRVPVAVRANLTLPGSSFEDYRAALTGDARWDIRRVRRKLRDAGIAVSPRRLGDHLDEVVRLRCALRRKYGRPVDEADERALLESFSSAFGERTMLFCAEREGHVVSFSLFVWDGRVWHAWFTGGDNDPQSRYAYFETLFHAPIEWAYEHGIREISFGYGTESAKRSRGVRLEPVHAWFMPLEDGLAPALGKAAAVLASPKPAVVQVG